MFSRSLFSISIYSSQTSFKEISSSSEDLEKTNLNFSSNVWLIIFLKISGRFFDLFRLD